MKDLNRTILIVNDNVKLKKLITKRIKNKTVKIVIKENNIDIKKLKKIFKKNS